MESEGWAVLPEGKIIRFLLIVDKCNKFFVKD